MGYVPPKAPPKSDYFATYLKSRRSDWEEGNNIPSIVGLFGGTSLQQSYKKCGLTATLETIHLERIGCYNKACTKVTSSE